jgi:membrane associated rhomboid family serine protease
MSLIRRLPEAPVTLGLIVVNLLVYLVMAVASRRVVSFDTATLVGAGASVSGIDLPVSHWRWLTATFVHVNLLHILMNLWVLAQIGVISERALGRGLFAATYVVTGTLGNVLSSAIAAWRGHPTISAGASGAIMGLIGMAATFSWRSGQRAVARALAFNILFVLGVGLSLSARGVGLVDNAAHIGGLVVGAAAGLVRVEVRRPAPRWLDRGLIATSIALTAVAFVAMRLSGS